jgi:hypothetical protein
VTGVAADGGPAPAGAPARLTLVTPEDWYRLPLLEEARLRRAVGEFVGRQFSGRDDRPALRAELTGALLDQAHQARDGGAVDMYLSGLPVGGVPLALSLVVTLLPFPADRPSLEALAPGFDDDVAQATVVELPAGPALRRRRVATTDLPEFGTPQVDALLVDYVLPGPEDTALLLTFSSPLVPVAEALAELFEAVAATVRWSA